MKLITQGGHKVDVRKKSDCTRQIMTKVNFSLLLSLSGSLSFYVCVRACVPAHEQMRACEQEDLPCPGAWPSSRDLSLCLSSSHPVCLHACVHASRGGLLHPKAWHSFCSWSSWARSARPCDASGAEKLSEKKHKVQDALLFLP